MQAGINLGSKVKFSFKGFELNENSKVDRVK